MASGFPQPKHMPCPDCGASVERAETDGHVCEQDRWLDYQMIQAREEVDLLGSDISTYLDSPAGRFESWYAERDRDQAE